MGPPGQWLPPPSLQASELAEKHVFTVTFIYFLLVYLFCSPPPSLQVSELAEKYAPSPGWFIKIVSEVGGERTWRNSR
jgi:hypothetical protein